MISYKDKKTVFIKWLRASSVSIVIHLIGFMFITFLANLSVQNAMVNPKFYTVEFHEYISTSEIVEEEVLNNNETEVFETTEAEASQQFSLRDIDADTTNLDQLYKENTLNVSIKYPKGWTFVDQNVKNKLDGVTFWASDGLYNPPPYIHLEVRDKYYFNEQKYMYQIEFDDCIAYYNDPEIIENYYIQNVYLRTETSQDFNIKLMIVGKEAFNSFQPKFFGMIKTFNFGSSFL
ncbi:MAG: hypothetical protein R6W68_04885 [Ignavibacteriaceae bacterium]